MSIFNNDRLSHWCIGAVLSWGLSSLLIGLPIFHLWLGVPIRTIVAFTAFAAALQLAVTPWLFSARATAENPMGRLDRRRAAVIVWLGLLSLLFDYFMMRGDNPDLGARVIFLGGPIFVGTGALIALTLISHRKRKAGQSDSGSR